MGEDAFATNEEEEIKKYTTKMLVLAAAAQELPPCDAHTCRFCVYSEA